MMIIRNKVSLVAAFLVAILMAGAASAGEFHLTNSNVPELAGIDIKVTTDGAGKTMSVVLVSNPLANAPKGIDKFYYNFDGANQIISDDDPSGIWSMLNNPPVIADGFGSFANGANNPGGTGGLTGSPITFTLANQFSDANITANAKGANFTVHIRFGDDCSGFVSDGTTTSIESNSDCKRQPVSVPEFPALALPVVAVMALMFILHRKVE